MHPARPQASVIRCNVLHQAKWRLSAGLLPKPVCLRERVPFTTISETALLRIAKKKPQATTLPDKFGNSDAGQQSLLPL